VVFRRFQDLGLCTVCLTVLYVRRKTRAKVFWPLSDSPAILVRGSCPSRHFFLKLSRKRQKKRSTNIKCDNDHGKGTGSVTRGAWNDPTEGADRGTDLAQEKTMADTSDWIELTEGKQFSRLLYTNPVCFLCTTTNSTGGSCSVDDDDDDDGDDDAKSPSTTTLPATSNATEEVIRSAASHNVMVLSWLTATNNNGRFMFSLNRRRHSSSLLKSSITSSSSSSEFTLSVPVQGMEELVRSVGSVSGQFGSKFPADYKDVLVGSTASAPPGPPMSKRQRKKEPRFPTGIPGLGRVSMEDSEARSASGSSNHGNDSRANSHSHSRCFAIEGTVAQLVCRVYRVMSSSPSSDPTEPLSSAQADNDNEGSIIDDDHDLFLAEVVRARVRPDYFDVAKNLFRPATADTPPYLTFFGSQTFGYVVSAPSQVETP
jgi:flavin reductase (DIM6/NTAB) family NADH-FMN oxidoreductase RutF